MAGSNFNNYFRGLAEASANPPKFESKGSDIHKVTLTHYFSPGQVRVILHPCEKKSPFLQLSEKIQQKMPHVLLGQVLGTGESCKILTLMVLSETCLAL